MVGGLALIAGALVLLERSAIVDFYLRQPIVACGETETASVPEGVERHAVSDFYRAGLVSSGLGSHVSRRIGYHRLMADFVVARLVTHLQPDALYGRTPCGFRRR